MGASFVCVFFFFFNDSATTEIYTRSLVGSVRCVLETGDIRWKEHTSITLGLNFAFHEGGEFLYEVGGNYLPNSDLSDPLLQTGDKPLPDGVTIRYQLQYLEVPVGLKFRFKEKGNVTYFLEAPVLTFSFLTRGRGDIESEDFLYEQENIKKDLVVPNLFIGFGAGMEYAISQNNSLKGGIN